MSALVLLGVGIVMIVAEIFFGSFFFIFLLALGCASPL